MKDWRKLSAGRKLNRLIAEELGWEIAQDIEYSDLLTGLRPEKERTIEGPAAGTWEVPDFSRSLSASLALIESYDFYIYHYVDGIPAKYRVLIKDHLLRTGTGLAETLSLAVCYSWLNYQEDHHDGT